MNEPRDLNAFFAASRPLVERALELAEQFSDLGKAARDQGYEWSLIKALLKAEIQDAEDGGERVQRLIGKAGCAQIYADVLATKINKKNFSSAAPAKTNNARIAPETANTAIEPGPAPLESKNIAPQVAAAATGGDFLDIPPFLRRTA